ncbi:MAG: hypothetical protein WC688_04605 [Parachlamydiales bacterium]
MSSINGPSPLSPNEKELYRKDFEKGSEIFKDAMQEYTQTNEAHKKEMLKKAMNETLQAMNEILNNVLHEKGGKFEKMITDDYQNFIENSNSSTMNDLNKDIDKIKKSL